jgi:predicted dithiol-disulfide oxidoreductase (DUF899 family)
MKGKGESNEYRKLRDQLLEAEIALKDQRERVAALRRQLPMSGLAETDYIFREGPSDIRDESPANFRDVRLSQLFAPGKDRLIIDHMMWAANDKLPCPMCNMWADGYAAIASHVSNKVNFALVAKVDLATLRDWGRGRGWNKIRLLSSHDNTFNKDFLMEEDGGRQRPASAYSAAQRTERSTISTRQRRRSLRDTIAGSTFFRLFGISSISSPKAVRTGCRNTPTDFGAFGIATRTRRPEVRPDHPMRG